MAKDENLFNEKLQKIRARYVSSLPERIEELESVLGARRADGGSGQDSEGPAQMRHLAHKLVGSSKQLARQLQRIKGCGRWHQNQRGNDNSKRTTV